jgi:hypothetical protein
VSGRAHFETFDAADGVRWRAQAANGRFDGHSEQAFDDQRDARRAIEDHVRTCLFAAGLDPDMPIELDIEHVEVG